MRKTITTVENILYFLLILIVTICISAWVELAHGGERLYVLQKQSFDAATGDPKGPTVRLSQQPLTAGQCNDLLVDLGPAPVQHGIYTIYRCASLDSLGEKYT